MIQVKEESPIGSNFNLVTHSDEFLDFKELFYETSGVSLIPEKVDELLLNTVKEMDLSFESVLDNTINNLNDKINEMKQLNPARVTKSSLS